MAISSRFVPNWRCRQKNLWSNDYKERRGALGKFRKNFVRGKTQSKHPISLNCFSFNRLLLAAHVKAGKKD